MRRYGCRKEKRKKKRKKVIKKERKKGKKSGKKESMFSLDIRVNYSDRK